jgi:hypothetical protein
VALQPEQDEQDVAPLVIQVMPAAKLRTHKGAKATTASQSSMTLAPVSAEATIGPRMPTSAS